MNRLDEVTNEQWDSINKQNRKIAEEFIEQSPQLSDQTLKQYVSALRQYFWYVHEHCDDKNFYEIKSRDFLLYQNYLVKQGLSSSAIRLKRSVVSSLNGYVEVYYEEEYPTFRNYVNKRIALPTPGFVHDKNPLTLEEYEKLCQELEKQELWQQLAYIRFSFSSGARRAEVGLLLKEIVNYEPKLSTVVKKNEDGSKEELQVRSYITHKIRCKGRGKEGKVRTLQFDETAMQTIKKWLDVRGEDDCPYVFVIKGESGPRQVSQTTFNAWSDSYFTKIVGRRFHPHLLRESRATSLVVEKGADIGVAQKLLGHTSSQTTEIYVIRKDEDDSDGAFV